MKKSQSGGDLPTIERLLELQQLIADFARVERVPQLADSGRAENDVEHSYGLAITCWYLAPKIAPELDMLKIFQYALAHDSVEIHAGDTFLFGDEKLLASKPERERAAIEKLKISWPDFGAFTDFATGYMDKPDDESKFVYSVDKLLPVLMIGLGEKHTFYDRHTIDETQMRSKKENTIKTSAAVAPYYDLLMDWLKKTDQLHQTTS